MCSGTIDPVLLIDAFLKGSDGVLVGGCRLGDCHYGEGNYFAQWKVKLTKKLLDRIGFDGERIDIQFMSSAEGERYVKVVTEFAEKIKAIGPNPILSAENGGDMVERLEAVRRACGDFRLRALVGKFRKVAEKENVYGEILSEEEIEKLLDDAANSEYIRSRIMLLVKEKPHSVVQLAGRIGEAPDVVLRHLAHLRRQNLLDLDHVEGLSPLYSAL
jgi:coenzyme F420-reducing hydrogenase delta subunit